jgi:hypothetical protein
LTHRSQDQDHGALTSPRILSSTGNALVDSSASSSEWIDDVTITDPYTYHISDIYFQQPIR